MRLISDRFLYNARIDFSADDMFLYNARIDFLADAVSQIKVN